ncbi:MAG: hypothetical protein M1834_003640 [Cirrosporium novae-zelandiae]|nr:MAG: hypothetical protein M1834_003640 [Cirrosporium novae-zelandiae]
MLSQLCTNRRDMFSNSAQVTTSAPPQNQTTQSYSTEPRPVFSYTLPAVPTPQFPHFISPFSGTPNQISRSNPAGYNSLIRYSPSISPMSLPVPVNQTPCPPQASLRAPTPQISLLNTPNTTTTTTSTTNNNSNIPPANNVDSHQLIHIPSTTSCSPSATSNIHPDLLQGTRCSYSETSSTYTPASFISIAATSRLLLLQRVLKICTDAAHAYLKKSTTRPTSSTFSPSTSTLCIRRCPFHLHHHRYTPYPRVPHNASASQSVSESTKTEPTPYTHPHSHNHNPPPPLAHSIQKITNQIWHRALTLYSHSEQRRAAQQMHDLFSWADMIIDANEEAAAARDCGSVIETERVRAAILAARDFMTILGDEGGRGLVEKVWGDGDGVGEGGVL